MTTPLGWPAPEESLLLRPDRRGLPRLLLHLAAWSNSDVEQGGGGAAAGHSDAPGDRRGRLRTGCGTGRRTGAGAAGARRGCGPMTETVRAVIYGVKSSPDERESVADQQRIVREAIGDDDRIIGTFGEANQSGYRKERGPELEKAMRCAIDAAAEHGEAELWVWHSSRLARGDGSKGKRSISKIVADLLYEN